MGPPADAISRHGCLPSGRPIVLNFLALPASLEKKAVDLPDMVCVLQLLRHVASQDKEVQEVQKLVPYKIVDGQDGAAWVEVQGNKMSPSQVSLSSRRCWGLRWRRDGARAGGGVDGVVLRGGGVIAGSIVARHQRSLDSRWT